jgi:hypothetical protein
MGGWLSIICAGWPGAGAACCAAGAGAGAEAGAGDGAPAVLGALSEHPKASDTMETATITFKTFFTSHPPWEWKSRTSVDHQPEPLKKRFKT